MRKNSMANGRSVISSEPLRDGGLLVGSEQAFPPLHNRGARTLIRDRWERLVSSIELPHPPAEIWDVLTNPERLVRWFAACHGSLQARDRDTVLDFEDGEFFLVHTVHVNPPNELTYLARWLGIGQATSVDWHLEDIERGTRVTVTEEAKNPPWDWQTWNGGGWPGILDQMSAHVRTGTTWRWPWRRMGPYAQIELPVSIYASWDSLFSAPGLKYWLLNMNGSLQKGSTVPILMGDASGLVEMSVDEVVQPGERPPSFLPYVTYRLRRPSWNAEIAGRLWLEPAGWGSSLLQVFNYNWESLPGALQLSERRICTSYWADAVRRAREFIMMPKMPTAPHNW